MSDTSLQQTIEQAWDDRDAISTSTSGPVREAVETALNGLDGGELRVAEKTDGGWVVHQWLKKSVLLSFRLNDMSGGVWRRRRRHLVGQGAIQIRGLGRKPVPRGRLPRRAERGRAPFRTYRARCRPDA